MRLRAHERAVSATLFVGMTALAGCRRPAEIVPEPSASPSAVPRENDAIVRIEKDAVLFGSERLIALEGDRSKGAAASYKRSGPNDLYLVPLAERIATARGDGRLKNALTIVVEPDTPYRVVFEVLFTAGQSEVGHFDLREGSTDGRLLSTDPPKVHVPTPMIEGSAAPPAALNLVVLLVQDGVSVKVAVGNVAPGCDSIGRGLAFPRVDGKLDVTGVAACAQKLKKAEPRFANESSFTLTANPATPFRELVDVALALEDPKAASPFKEVYFGVAR